MVVLLFHHIYYFALYLNLVPTGAELHISVTKSPMHCRYEDCVTSSVHNDSRHLATHAWSHVQIYNHCFNYFFLCDFV